MSLIKKRGITKPIKRKSRYASVKRRDVYIKTFTNSLFPKEKKLHEIIPYKILGLLLFCCIIIYTLYFFFFSTYNQITEIAIETPDSSISQTIYEIVQNHLAQRRFVVFKEDNIYTLNTHKLEEVLQTALPHYTIVAQVDKPIITIIVENERGALHWYEEGKTYLLNNEGGALRILPSYTPHIEKIENENKNLYKISLMLDQRELPLVYNESSVNTIAEHEAIPKTFIDKIKAFDTLIKDIPEIRITSYHVSSVSGGDIKADTLDSWNIFFSTHESMDIQDQIIRLKILLQEKFTDNDHKDLQYIDLRAGDRVFYKNQASR